MPEEKLIKDFEQPKIKSFLKKILLPAGIILFIIFAGGVSGYFLSHRQAIIGRITDSQQLIGGRLVQIPKEVGSKDVTFFKDRAEGKLEENNDQDIPEGSHKLLRSGGPSQTAYLTSSVVDLNQFIGKCIEVWGQTVAARKAGWLMDVGRVKVLERCPGGIDD